MCWFEKTTYLERPEPKLRDYDAERFSKLSGKSMDPRGAGEGILERRIVCSDNRNITRASRG